MCHLEHVFEHTTLDFHKDDLEAAIETFSKDRVKEGNALTDLSFYTLSYSDTQQTLLMMEGVIRSRLHKMMPMFFDPYPMDKVAQGGKLSEAYAKMNKLGIIQRVRKTNDTMMREYFEKKSGMLSSPMTNTVFSAWNMVIAVVIISIVLPYFFLVIILMYKSSSMTNIL